MKLKYKFLMIISSILVVLLCLSFLYYFVIYSPNKKEKEETERLIKEYYENKLVSYQKENEQYDDYEVDIAFLGDSLTDGYDLKKYYPNYLCANRGIAGDTTFGLEKRLKISAYELKPKIVVMLIGGNNLDSMFENYENILIGLKDNLPNTKKVLISLTAMGKTLKDKNELSAINNVKISLLAKKYKYTYVDVFSHLYDITSNEIYAKYTNDGAHFTDLGYECVTNVINPYLENLLMNY